MSNQKDLFDKLGTIKYRDVDIERINYPKGSVVLVIDMDTLMFRVASACQDDFIRVTNKEGKSKNFKHRTAFKEHCEEKGWDWKDFTIVDQVKHEPLDYCLNTLKRSVANLKKKFGITHIEMYHGGSDNFRSKLLLPEPYKGNRKEVKPVHLADCATYAEKVLGSKHVTGLETDDIVQMRFIDITSQDGVICYLATIDKDAKQVYQIEKVMRIINLMSNTIETFDGGLGELHFNARDEVKGTGLKWLLFQLMQGDDIDNYVQKRLFPKKYGEKSFFKDFDPIDNPKDLLQKYVDIVKARLPEVVKYTAWDGTEVELDWLEVQELYWKCAYMRVAPNDPTTFESLLKEYGIEY